MKTIFLSFILGLTFTFTIQAQHYCGFDHMRDAYILEHPGFDHVIHSAEQAIHERIVQHNVSHGGGEIMTIPVVVHIIHQNGDENISDEQVEQAIEWLNDSFANTGFYSSPDGVQMPIQFCLAHLDPDGELTTGINRVESPLTVVTIPDQDLELKDLSRWDPLSYMNIWVVAELIRAQGNTGIVGNSSLPAMHGSDADGVIIEAALFGTAENTTKAFIHEVGHYVGLYHTFEGGCSNDDCLLDGDHVCDTPPDGYSSSQACLNGNNSCDTDDDDESDNNPFRPVEMGGLGDQIDMQQNYMDYSSLTCYEFFTQGQADRCAAAILEIRSSLLESNKCNPPCTSDIQPDVVPSETTIFLGDFVEFENNSTNASAFSWFVNEQFSSTDENFIFIPTEVGNYFIEVLLQNDEAGCSVELEFNIEVLCQAQASFIFEGSNLLQDEMIVLDNNTSGVAEFVWTVDGIWSGTETNLEVSFSEFGTHQVCLMAIGPNCTTTDCALLSVGNCATGNENRHWITYTGEESINQMIFSPQGTEFITGVLDYAECKSSICDENGQLLFSTNGIQLFDHNLQVTPNGDGLSGGFSSRQGAIFVKAPGSDTQYYLFYSDQQEDSFIEGVNYSIVDRTLNDGNGDIVPGMKNVYITNSNSETLTAIRHCNYEDFWLLFYNTSLERYEAYLVTSEGIADEPVVYNLDVSNFTSGTTYYFDFRVSPKGDMFLHNKNLFHFNSATGEMELFHQFSFFEISFYDFSPTGRYLYIQSQTSNIQVFLHQIDVTLSAGMLEPEMYSINQPLLAIYSDIQRTPGGEIYLAGVFAGALDVIHFPDSPGEAMDLEYGAVEGIGFTNSFGNYFHAYNQTPLIIDGITKVCEDTPASFSLFGCAEGEVNWNISPPIEFSEPENGIVEITFETPGLYQLEGTIETLCGIQSGEVQIIVIDGTAPDLGPDLNVCEGESITVGTTGTFEDYSWSNGDDTPEISVDQPGEISLTTIDSEGCEYSDTLNVLQTITGIIDLGPDFEYCDSSIVILDAGNDFLDYTWQDGTTGSTYTVYEAGTYSVSASIPCDAFDSIVLEDCHDFIGEIGSNELLVYPNPAQTMLFVQSANGKPFQKLSITDTSGRLIYETTNFNSPLLEIDVEQWAGGAYQLTVVMNDLIKNRRILIGD